jgi:hypothetical protein
LLVSVGATFTAGAQATRVATPNLTQRPTLTPLLPDGRYVLTLTPAAMGSVALKSTQPIVVGAQVAHSGSSVSVTTSDGTALNGTGSVNHIKVSGSMNTSIMTVELGGTGTNASGTFLVAGSANHNLTGTASMAPAPHANAHTENGGGCDGIWDCIKVITGISWHFFGK